MLLISRSSHRTVAPCPVVPFPTALNPTCWDRCLFPLEALYGIHTQRAIDNFPLAGRPVNRHLVHAYGMVKLACARTNHELGHWSAEKSAAIEQACREMADGKLDDHIVVDALQGGAGTSTNMNVNEVLANRALQILRQPLGTYALVHPLDDLNLHQSTNDTFPTALKVAAIGQFRGLERDVTALLDAFQAKEREFAHIVKVGRTQLQDAVLTTLGRSMGAFADALARDRWRMSKCEERLRMINLGGTAIGTGLGAPRKFIFRAADHLQQITHMGLARAENLIDATQNLDMFVEASGMLRALACNLLKISNDLRLLSSGPDAGLGELALPPRQAGSSIMPGKVNPVIPEAVIQASLAITAHDQALDIGLCDGQYGVEPVSAPGGRLAPVEPRPGSGRMPHLRSALRGRPAGERRTVPAACRHVNGDRDRARGLARIHAGPGGRPPCKRTEQAHTTDGARASPAHARKPAACDLTGSRDPTRLASLRPESGRLPMSRVPRGNRLHIALFGRRNAGKSSLLNALTRQNVSIVSEIAGTTTDPVEKPMELLPIGPVVFIDTAGIDDCGALGELRVQKTRQVFDRADIAMIVTEADTWGDFETSIARGTAQPLHTARRRIQ